MGAARTFTALPADGPGGHHWITSNFATIVDREECLELLLEAFSDIAERDDIHQAAIRLAIVQQWIRDEAARAAADPIFSQVPTPDPVAEPVGTE